MSNSEQRETEYPTTEQLEAIIEASMRAVPTEISAEAFVLDSETAEMKYAIDLLPHDALALRQYAGNFILAIMKWEQKIVQFSHIIAEALETGNGDNVIAVLKSVSPKRTEAYRALIDAALVDWRIALLTSADIQIDHFLYWLPEYAGRVTPIIPVPAPSNEVTETPQ